MPTQMIAIFFSILRQMQEVPRALGFTLFYAIFLQMLAAAIAAYKLLVL